ncbi:hypothetical protein LV92_03167 [Arenibacter echinorum]|uniref:Uncharacterized protein n=1 Tax=Arenibacter echinorum TaxID=440515 RepID=A0A327QWG7_9FLAO|nr:hypothetical protein LV92_03167 [Arenibacter echinorum]
MLSYFSSPLYLTIGFLLLTVLSLLIFGKDQAESLWNIGGIVFGCYIIFSSILVLFIDAGWGYFFRILGYSILYLILSGILIQIIIQVRQIPGSNESAMIFLIIMFHPILLLFLKFIKWLFSILAQK